MSRYAYVGTELELFAAAHVWKSYFSRLVTPFLGREVLEVGAGLGGTTRYLHRDAARRWVCLEPDAALAERLRAAIARGAVPPCEVVVGTLDALDAGAGFDSILYIDVLEHIDDDAAELRRAAERLRPSGRLIVLSPAHAWLFTPFDAALGHFRRYSRRTLAAAGPRALVRERIWYLDSMGMLASLGNRVLLRRAHPTPAQIAFWDRVLVRASTWIDPLLGRRVGKSILGVWRKP